MHSKREPHWYNPNISQDERNMGIGFLNNPAEASQNKHQTGLARDRSSDLADSFVFLLM